MGGKAFLAAPRVAQTVGGGGFWACPLRVLAGRAVVLTPSSAGGSGARRSFGGMVTKDSGHSGSTLCRPSPEAPPS